MQAKSFLQSRDMLEWMADGNARMKRGAHTVSNPVLPNARKKQVWTVQSWQERTLLSAVSLQPRGPVVEMKLISFRRTSCC